MPRVVEVGSVVDLGVERPGWDIRPEPRPRVKGRRMEAAGEVKIAAGSVRDGM